MSLTIQRWLQRENRRSRRQSSFGIRDYNLYRGSYETRGLCRLWVYKDQGGLLWGAAVTWEDGRARERERESGSMEFRKEIFIMNAWDWKTLFCERLWKFNTPELWFQPDRNTPLYPLSTSLVLDLFLSCLVHSLYWFCHHSPFPLLSPVITLN